VTRTHLLPDEGLSRSLPYSIDIADRQRRR